MIANENKYKFYFKKNYFNYNVFDILYIHLVIVPVHQKKRVTAIMVQARTTETARGLLRESGLKEWEPLEKVRSIII